MNKKEKQEIIDTLKDFNTILSDENGNSDLKMLEVRSLKLNILLAQETLSSLKNNVWKNILYVAVGAVLASIPNIVNELRSSKEETELYKLEYEINDKHNRLKIDLQQMHLTIDSLKSEVETLSKN